MALPPLIGTRDGPKKLSPFGRQCHDIECPKRESLGPECRIVCTRQENDGRVVITATVQPTQEFAPVRICRDEHDRGRLLRPSYDLRST
jgi:hypothetical protein